ncbi:hypothetical protein GCM10015535_21360 [Streptomyces gelaticus]|uniref:Tetratricopeptide repeat protein n=2 Tax=Streptomyces gelaticus TaxID=285446 RepID=A0ABQ2VWJ3_9ACTN|nr:hypothetical protein GCM10015535_21360 [Streptomyces gelaticus]
MSTNSPDDRSEREPRRRDGGDRGGFSGRRDDRSGGPRRDNDRGGYRRDDSRPTGGSGGGGFRRDDRDRGPRRDDSRGGGSGGGFRRDDSRGGGFRRDDRDRDRDRGPRRDDERGGFRGPRRDDERGGRPSGGFERRDDRPRGPRRDDDSRGGGFRRDDRDRGPRRDDSRGGGSGGGFRRDDSRGGGYRGQRDDRGGRGGYRGRDDRGGYERRDDRDREPVKRLPIPEDVTGDEIDKDVRQELMSLPKTLAEDVSRNLVMVARLIDEDPEQAYAYSRIALRLASRVAAVREAAGFAAYATQKYSEALAEFRAAKRMTGSAELWPVMADCERGLGRPERALAMAGEPEVQKLDKAGQVEMRLVAAGARRDMGQLDAAIVTLQSSELASNAVHPWTARLRYAYADALLAAGREDEAREWFGKALEADKDGSTDASDRLAEMDGVEFVDALDEDEDGDENGESGEDENGEDGDKGRTSEA